MKKDFRMIVALAGAMTSGMVFGQGNDLSIPAAVTAGTQDESRAQNGRALLNVEDLKTLLSLETRDPSSAESATEKPGKKDFSQATPFQTLSLSSKEHQRLMNQIKSLQKKRSALELSWKKRQDAQASSLSQERKKLQLARISANSEQEAALARQLYKNLIAENTLQHAAEQELARFDRENGIWVDFRLAQNGRIIEAIYQGTDTLWAQQNNGSSRLSAGL